MPSLPAQFKYGAELGAPGGEYNKSPCREGSFVLKTKIEGVLAGHIVAMFSYYVAKLTAASLSMIELFLDSMILVASTDVEWL